MLLISLENKGFETTFTSVAATLNNIGPGLDGVGPMENFGGFHPFSKCVFMFDMLAGRLELIPMVILFTPWAWKKRKIEPEKRSLFTKASFFLSIQNGRNYKYKIVL